MKKFKVGERIRVIKYKNAQFHGIIHRMDPIMSANSKRVTGYWYIIKYCQTIDYFCKKGEFGLFSRHDITKGDDDGEKIKKDQGSDPDCS